MSYCVRCRTNKATMGCYCTACSMLVHREERDQQKRAEEERDRRRREEEYREREREYRERQDEANRRFREEELRLQEEAAEDAARAARDAAEAKRIAGLKTFTCSRCEATFNEERGKSAVKSPTGKPLCEDCLNALKECCCCKTLLYIDDKPQLIMPIEAKYEKTANGIEKHRSDEYCCVECRKSKMKPFFAIQETLASQYVTQEEEKARVAAKNALEAKQKKEKEEANRREKERMERERQAALRRQQREDNERKRISGDKKRAVVFGGIALAASILIGVLSGAFPWTVIAGAVIFGLSFAFKNIAAKLLFGLVIAIIPNALTALIWGVVTQYHFGTVSVVHLSCSVILWMVLGALAYPSKALWKDFRGLHGILSVFGSNSDHSSKPSVLWVIKETGLLFVALNGFFLLVTFLIFDFFFIKVSVTAALPIIFNLLWVAVFSLNCWLGIPDAFRENFGVAEVIILLASCFIGAVTGGVYTLFCGITGVPLSPISFIMIVAVIISEIYFHFFWIK